MEGHFTLNITPPPGRTEEANMDFDLVLGQRIILIPVPPTKIAAATDDTDHQKEAKDDVKGPEDHRKEAKDDVKGPEEKEAEKAKHGKIVYLGSRSVSDDSAARAMRSERFGTPSPSPGKVAEECKDGPRRKRSRRGY